MAMVDCFACCSGLIGRVASSSGQHASISVQSKANAELLSLNLNKQWLRHRTRSKKVSCIPRAGLDDASDNGKPTSKLATEDWQYLGKLFAGCTIGAGVIKYGSILAPRIAQPNLSFALLIIATPVVLGVVLLLLASYSNRQSGS